MYSVGECNCLYEYWDWVVGT